MLREFNGGFKDHKTRTANSLDFISRVSDLLAVPADVETTLDHITRAVVPEFADYCAVRIDDSGTERFATRHVLEGSPAATPKHPLCQLDVPLATPERALGAITFINTESQYEFDDYDAMIATELGRRAAAALQTARLFAELQDAKLTAEEQAIDLEEQSTELEIALHDLAVAEAEQRALIEAMRDVVLVLDSHGRYVKIPHTAPDLLYAPSNDLVGKRMHDVMPAEAADGFLAVIRKALKTQDAVRMEYSLPIGGRLIWFSAVVSPLSHDQIVWVARDVTPQKEAEHRLKSSETRYRLLFESNPMPMWVYDRETLRFVWVNTAAIQQYGYTREEFLAMTIADIRPPEDVARLRNAVADHETTLHQSSGWRHRRKDGSLIDVEITAHPLEVDGRMSELVLSTDVTFRRKAEAELQEQADILRAVIDDSPLAIVSVDLDGRVTRWNPAAERLFGWPTNEIVGQHFELLVPESQGSDYYGFMRRVLDGELVADAETVRRRKDGSIFHASVSLAPLHNRAGGIRGFMAIVVDISQRKSIEAQLRQSGKMEAIGHLAGGIAHDFNNLLTAITGYSDLLLEDLPENDPLFENAAEIQRAAELASVLTRQLLAFSRQQVFKSELLPLNTIVSEIERILRRVIRENIVFCVTMDPTAGVVEADRAQIDQVILNLVINAQDAISDSGKIEARTYNAIRNDRHYVVLAVSDNGAGMTEEVMQRIFEPFFTTKDVDKGTGLGLSTVYGIVGQAGGFVEVDSAPGCGSTFYVYLPRVEAPAGEGQMKNATPEIPSSRGETILLVEDNQVVRAIAARSLARHGYNLIEARTAGEALVIFQQNDRSIDLVLTDVVMPEMSGLDLVRRMRQSRPALRVLYMSGYSKEALEFTEMSGPVTGYLEKPFTPSGLATKVRELLTHELTT